MVAHQNRFIDDVDLSMSTSLTHLLDRHEREVDLEEVHIIKHSPYYSETKFTQLIQSKPGLCILDLNIQNIYTKFDEFELFVNRVNSGNTISAICLNECWLNENSDLSGIQLHNYNMFYKLGNRTCRSQSLWTGNLYS